LDAVVVYHANEVPDFPRFRAYAPRLFAHLVERYEIADVFGGDPAGATILLLAARSPTSPDRPLPLEAATVVAPGVRRPFAEQTLVAASAWPFDEVLRVTTQPAGAVELHVPLAPAAGERLETACAYDPERFGEVFVPPSTWAVAVVADGTRTDVAGRRLDPLRRPDDRRAAPVSVDLGPWAGRSIELVLSIEGPHGAPADANLVGWVRPRVVGAR
jgi:hypothetical protein